MWWGWSDRLIHFLRLWDLCFAERPDLGDTGSSSASTPPAAASASLPSPKHQSGALKPGARAKLPAGVNMMQALTFCKQTRVTQK